MQIVHSKVVIEVVAGYNILSLIKHLRINDIISILIRKMIYICEGCSYGAAAAAAVVAGNVII